MDFPIYFKTTRELTCRGFSARAVVTGRALLTEDEAGCWWCNGVEPGGLTASGRGAGMAFAAFKLTLAEILSDIGAESQTIEELRANANAFVAEADDAEAVAWEAARVAIRGGEELPWDFEKTPRVTTVWNAGAEVTLLQRVESVTSEAVAVAQQQVA